MFGKKKFDIDKDNQHKNDDNLDFDIPDFDAPPPKDDRAATTKIVSGVAKGAMQSLTSPTVIAKTMRTALPKGYGDVMDVGDEVLDNAKELYDKAGKTIKPSIREMSKAVNKLLPASATKTREALAKIEGWATGDVYEKGPSTEQQRESALSLQMADVFKEQAKQTVRDKQVTEAKETIKEGIDIKRHHDIFGLLNGININTTRLAQYQDSITIAYQKKSLELQYRHYYLGVDSLAEAKKANALTAERLDVIVKNTALPEQVKVNSSEIGKGIRRNKFHEAMNEGLFGGRDAMVKKFFSNVSNKVQGKLSSMADALSKGAQGIEDINDATEDNGFGGQSKTDLLTGMAGSIGIEALLNKLSLKARKKLEENYPELVGKVNEATRYTENLHDAANQFKKSKIGENEDNTNFGNLKNFLVRGLKDLIPGMGHDKSIEKDTLKNINDPQVFTRQTHKSINEIIPGYLARILREVTAARTGNANTDLELYDFNKNTFVPRKQLSKNVKEDVISDSGKKASANLEGLVDLIDPNNKLPRDLREKLKASFVKKLLSGETLDLTDPMGSIKSKDFHKGSGISARELKEVDLSIRESERGKTIAEKQEQKLNIFRQFGNARASIKDARGVVQDLVDTGYSDVLEELGYLDKDGDFNLKSFNRQFNLDSLEYGKAKDLSDNIARIKDSISKKANEKKLKQENHKEGKFKINVFTEKELADKEKVEEEKNKIKSKRDKEEDKKTTRSKKDDAIRAKSEAKFKEKQDSKKALRDSLKPDMSPVFGSLKAKEDEIKSDINAKEDIKPADSKKTLSSTLDAIRRIPIFNWKYKKNKTPEGYEPGAEHTGPMAQSVNKELGDQAAPGGTKIDVPTLMGANMQAVQELDKKVDGKLNGAVTSAGPKGKGELFELRTANSHLVDIKEILQNTAIIGMNQLNNAAQFMKAKYDFVAGSIKDFDTKNIKASISTLAQGALDNEKVKEYRDRVGVMFNDAKGKAKEFGEFVEGSDAYKKAQEAKDKLVNSEGYQSGKTKYDSMTEKLRGVVNEELQKARDASAAEDSKVTDHLKVLGLTAGQLSIDLGGAAAGVGGSTYDLAKKGYNKAKEEAIKLKDKLIGKWNEAVNVYVGDEETPRLLAVEIKAGKFFIKRTMTPINNADDIIDEICTADGEIVIKKDEVPLVSTRLRRVGSVLKRGVFFLKDKAVGLYNSGMNRIRMIPAAITDIKNKIKAMGKFAFNLFDMPTDIYVKGKPDAPVMTALVMRSGGYVSAKTGKVIERPSMIDGAVKTLSDKGTENGLIVLSDEDIKTGIVDKDGNPIRGPIEKLTAKLKSSISAVAGFGLKVGKKIWGKLKDTYHGGMEFLTKMWNGIDVGFGISSKKTIDILTKIHDLLDERLNSGKKRKFNDKDGDGKRDGGVEDQQAKEKAHDKEQAEEKEAEEKKAKETADNDNKDQNSKHQNIFDIMAGAATGVKNGVMDTASKAAEAYALYRAGKGPKVPPPEIHGPHLPAGNVPPVGKWGRMLNWGKKGLDVGLTAGGAALAAGGMYSNRNNFVGPQIPSQQQLHTDGHLVGPMPQPKASLASKTMDAVDIGGTAMTLGGMAKGGYNFFKNKFTGTPALTNQPVDISKLSPLERKARMTELIEKNKLRLAGGAPVQAAETAGKTGTLSKIIPNAKLGFSKLGSGIGSLATGTAKLGGLGVGGVAKGAIAGAKALPGAIGGIGKLGMGAAKLGLGAAKLGGRFLGPVGVALGAMGAYEAAKAGNYTEAAIEGGLGLAGVGTTLAMLGTAGAAVVGSPVLLAAAIAAAVGAVGYVGYKFITRNNLNKIEMLRYIQYGFSKDKTDYASKILSLEDVVKDNLIFEKGSSSARIDGKKFKLEEACKIFGVSQKDEDAFARFIYWFGKRFKPVYLTHVSALHNIDPKLKLEEADKLKPEDREKYIKNVSFPDGPYSVTDSPFPEIESLPSGAPEVRQYVDEMKEGFAKEDKKNVKGGTLKDAVDKKKADKEKEDKKFAGDLTVMGSIKETMKEMFKDGIFNGLTKAVDNLGTTIVTGVGSMITQTGKAITKKLGFSVDAFEAVRFKTYGLIEMERSKVADLRNLEANMIDFLKFEGTGAATFSGNVENVIGRCEGDFGISYIKSPGAMEWIAWFNKRFLPVYLNYASLVKAATNQTDLSLASDALKSGAKYEIAVKIAAGNVWNVNDSPWAHYFVNLNNTTPKDNLEFLHDAADKELLAEQAAKKKADRTKEIKAEVIGKKPDASKATDVKEAIEKKGFDPTKKPMRDFSKGSLDQPSPDSGSSGSDNLKGSSGGTEAQFINSSIIQDAGKYENVKYRMGAKDPDEGVVDCSGWITRVNKDGLNALTSLIPNFNAEGVKKAIFNGGGAAGIIKALEDNGGKVISKDQLTVDKLTEGMIIGETNGADFAKGRHRDIDHIVQVVRDPKSGNLMISESRGGKGVDLTPVDTYLEKKKASKKNAGLFAIDAVSVYKKISDSSTDDSKGSKGNSYAGSVDTVKDASKPANNKPVSDKVAIATAVGTSKAPARQAVNDFKDVVPGGATTADEIETGDTSTSGIIKVIDKAAKATGADPILMKAMAATESSFDPNAKNKGGSASGLFQFMPKTWKEMIDKNGSKYSLTNPSVFDPKANALMGGEYIAQNTKSMKGYKTDINGVDIYIAHHFGATGAKKFLSASPNAIGAEVLPDAAAANKEVFYDNGRPRTVSQIYDFLKQKLTKNLETYGLTSNLSSAKFPNAGGTGLNTATSAPGLNPTATSPGLKVVTPSVQSGISTEVKTNPNPTVAKTKQSDYNGLSSFGINNQQSSDVQNPRADMNTVIGNVDTTLKQSLTVQTKILEALTSIMKDRSEVKAKNSLNSNESIVEPTKADNTTPSQSYSPGLGLKPPPKARLDPPVSMKRLIV